MQGAVGSHAGILRGLGAKVREVRTPAHLTDLAGLVIPGGESSVMMLGIEREKLAEPLREFASSGRPVLGTCAGMIVLDKEHLGLLGVVAERNAFGRQSHSFECTLPVQEVGTVHAVFIRAPRVVQCSTDVAVLAEIDGYPVAVQQGNLMAISFHPELVGETRLHRRFLDSC